MNELLETIRRLYVNQYTRAGHPNPEQAAAYAVQDTLNMFKGQPQYIEQLLGETIEDLQKPLRSAINETQTALDKALAYNEAFQKPAQIKYYRKHLAYLKGETTARAVADRTAWDDMNCVLEARAKM